MKPLTIKNTVLGDGIPKICIPVTGRDEASILRAAGELKTLPHDIVEWRADYFDQVTDQSRVLYVLGALKELLPDSLLLFTFRTHREGGVKELSTEAYLEICKNAVTSGLPDLLDLEFFTGASGENAEACPSVLNPVLSLAHVNGCRVILSSHDFHKTPPEEELFRRLSCMDAAGADIAKLAVMPRSETDVLHLLSATRRAADLLSCPVITMSMGRLGVISRISGRLTGSCLTFGTAGEASAPGQLPAKKLKKILETL